MNFNLCSLKQLGFIHCVFVLEKNSWTFNYSNIFQKRILDFQVFFQKKLKVFNYVSKKTILHLPVVFIYSLLFLMPFDPFVWLSFPIYSFCAKKSKRIKKNIFNYFSKKNNSTFSIVMQVYLCTFCKSITYWLCKFTLVKPTSKYTLCNINI